MAKQYIDWKRLEQLSQGNVDIEVSLLEKGMKLTEETGELAAEILAYSGSKNVSASSSTKDIKMAVLNEACDVLNVTLDIINSLDVTDDEAKTMFTKKLDKWESKVNKILEEKISVPPKSVFKSIKKMFS